MSAASSRSYKPPVGGPVEYLLTKKLNAHWLAKTRVHVLT